MWKRESLAADAFADALRTRVAAALLEAGAQRLAVNVVDRDVESSLRVRITRFDPPPAAVVTFWLDACDDREPCERALAAISSRMAGYLVVESVPLVNRTHTAALGQRTPGTNMIALIERPERMSYEAWIAHWHGHHKRVALETQCTYAYVRNVVVRALTKDAPPWAGIVEEGFPSAAVTDPMLWYRADGSAEKMQANLTRMIESVQVFLDIARVESHPMSEYRITA